MSRWRVRSSLSRPLFLRVGSAKPRRDSFAGFWELTVLAHGLSANWFCRILYALPLFNRFRWPFKIQLFTSFFLVCAGAAALQFWLGRARGAGRRILIGSVLGLTLADFAAVAVLNRPRGWIDQAPLSREHPLVGMVRGGRVFSLGYRVREQWRPGVNRSRSLGYEYAPLWGYDDLGGYDPLALAASTRVAAGAIHAASWEGPAQWLPLDHFRAWGVRWYVVNAAAPEYADALAKQGVEIVLAEPDRIRMRDPNTRPFVWWADDDASPVVVTRHVNSAEFRYVRASPGAMIINLAALPFLRPDVDGRAIAIGGDDEGHVRLALPAGQHLVRLRYRDQNFHAGLRLAGLGVLPLLAGFWLSRKGRQS